MRNADCSDVTRDECCFIAFVIFSTSSFDVIAVDEEYFTFDDSAIVTSISNNTEQ